MTNLKIDLFRFVAILILSTFPFHALSQGKDARKLPSVGIFATSEGNNNTYPTLDAFKVGLSALGYEVGKNIHLEARFAGGDLAVIPKLVQEILDKKVDVLVAPNNVAIQAAMKVTQTIPIVFISTIDPVEAKYVKSLEQPGGNLTGIASLNRQLAEKRLNLLKEFIPNLSRVGVIWDPQGPGPREAFEEYQALASKMNFALQSLELKGRETDVNAIILEAKKAKADAIVLVGNPLMAQLTKKFLAAALEHKIPATGDSARITDHGGLASYGTNRNDLHRKAANFVDEILKGKKPSEIPVMVNDTFELTVNMNTVKAMGLTLPKSIPSQGIDPKTQILKQVVQEKL